MFIRCCASLIALFAIATATPVAAEDITALRTGHYRIQGACTRIHELGAPPPSCQSWMGIQVKEPGKEMFMFPLTGGAKAWMFVAGAPQTVAGGRIVYPVEILYDQALETEFFYAAGECETSPGPAVRCSVWKDKERTTLSRELVFTGSGQWLHQQ